MSYLCSSLPYPYPTPIPLPLGLPPAWFFPVPIYTCPHQLPSTYLYLPTCIPCLLPTPFLPTSLPTTHLTPVHHLVTLGQWFTLPSVPHACCCLPHLVVLPTCPSPARLPALVPSGLLLWDVPHSYLGMSGMMPSHLPVCSLDYTPALPPTFPGSFFFSFPFFSLLRRPSSSSPCPACLPTLAPPVPIPASPFYLPTPGLCAPACHHPTLPTCPGWEGLLGPSPYYASHVWPLLLLLYSPIACVPTPATFPLPSLPALTCACIPAILIGYSVGGMCCLLPVPDFPLPTTCGHYLTNLLPIPLCSCPLNSFWMIPNCLIRLGWDDYSYPCNPSLLFCMSFPFSYNSRKTLSQVHALPVCVDFQTPSISPPHFFYAHAFPYVYCM